jgi:hypothetical protein
MVGTLDIRGMLLLVLLLAAMRWRALVMIHCCRHD